MPFDPQKNKIINLGTITQEPEKIADQVGFTKGKNRDQEDWFKFTLDKKSDFNLTLDQLQQNADIILYDGKRSIIDTAKNQGQEPENINTFLDAGTYFLKVVPKGSDKTDYLLSLNAITADRSGDKLNLAENLGRLGKKGLSVKDSIGFTIGGSRDSKDYYKFRLKDESDVTISLDELKQNANIELLDRSGSLLFSSSKSGVDFDRINTILEDGIYYVLVEPFSGDRTDYLLNLVANPNIKDKDGQIGNNLKKLTTSKSIVDNIGFNRGFRDQSDFYELELKKESQVTISLDGLKKDANIELYDRYSTFPLYESKEKGTRVDTIEAILPEDTYYVKVKPKSSGGTSYKLDISTSKDFMDPDGLLPGEDLGVLTQKEDIARRGTIGFTNSSFTDKNDYYQFALKKRSEVSITLDDLDANANISLLDARYTGYKEIAKSDRAQRNSESILETLSPGTYHLLVDRLGNQRTDYRLRLNADPVEDDYPNLTLAKELGDLNLQDALKERDRIGFKKGTIKDDNDFYGFELSEKSEVSLTLDGLSANAELKLLDEDGKKIDESKKSRKSPEAIAQVLEPGSYYVNVLPFGAQKTPYRLELKTEPYVPEYDSLATAKDWGSIAPASESNSEVTSQINERNRIGFRKGSTKDENDFYRFELNEKSDINITLDGLSANAELELLDKDGNKIDESKKSKKASEAIAQLLEPGSYYARVLPFGAQKTKYRLELRAETLIEEYDSLATAKDWGSVAPASESNPEIISKIRDRNRIGFKQGSTKDENDFYRFELTEKSDISLTLEDLDANAELELLDEDGKNIGESKKSGKNPEAIAQPLEPGTYYAKVLPFGAQKTKYRLELKAETLIEEYDSLATAKDWGSVAPASESNPEIISKIRDRNRIGFKQGSTKDENDFYRFELTEKSDISLTLEDLDANAELELLDKDGKNIDESKKSRKSPEAIAQLLEPGTYYAKVLPFGAQKTKYRLGLSVSPGEDVDGFLPGTPLGDLTLQKRVKQRDRIGFKQGSITDEKDYYSFSVSEPGSFSLKLDNLTANANATLFKPIDPNLPVTDESNLAVIWEGTKAGRNPESFQETLAVGNYYIKVDRFGAQNTPYRLTMDSKPIVPLIFIEDASTPEGNIGIDGNPTVTNLPFEVKLSEPSPNTVTVNYLVRENNATPGEDYNPVSGTLTFVPEDTSEQILVPVLGDSAIEPMERFVVELSGAVNGKIPVKVGANRATGIIENDDIPKISIADITISEENAGTSKAVLTASLDDKFNQEVRVKYVTADGTATEPSDYTNTSGSIVFAPNQLNRRFNVPIRGDKQVELDETFTVELLEPKNADIADGQALVTIQDNDLPRISIDESQVSLPEGNLGSDNLPTVTNYTFNVSLSNVSPKTVTVNYTVEGKDATVGEDFTATAGALSFAPGETAKQIVVPVLGDNSIETLERFFVKLSAPVDAKFKRGGDQATGIIQNDDFPKVSVADVTVTEGDSGTANAVFTVNLDVPFQQEVRTRYVTVDGTATQPSDYTRTSGVVIFGPEQTTKRFSVPVKGDNRVEGNETFAVDLKNAENANIADGQAVATIIDNDVAVEPRSASRSDFLTDGGESDRSSGSDYTVIAEFGDDGGSFGGYGLDAAAVLAEKEAELIGIAEDSGFSFV